MRAAGLLPVLCLAIFHPAFAQNETAAALLAQARAAFERNLLQEKHWSWTTTESRTIALRGRPVRPLPSVTVESVIRNDGRRCVAVLSWGDGIEPYALNADAETRCGNEEQLRTPLRVEALLRSTRVKLAGRLNGAVTLQIQPDKSRLHHADHDVRCTASIQATVRLDPATSFPVLLEGALMESGCEGETTQELHYGEEQPTQPLHRMLRKGTTFRLEYALQPDKFGHAENAFWIAVDQQWSRPFMKNARGLVFWNRRFEIAPAGPESVLLQTSATTAQEFGVASETRFNIPRDR